MNLIQAGQPWQLDPHTLKTHPCPETLGDFLTLDSKPSNPLATILDQAFGKKAKGQNLPIAEGKPIPDIEGKGKPAAPGKAFTAHPHVVHGEGMSDRLAVFSSHV